MKYIAMPGAAPSAAALAAATPAGAGQVPGSLAAVDIPVSHRDRVYSSDQFSNTVSIIDAAANRLVGVIRLGEPANFSPMWAFNPETDVAFRWWQAIAVGSLPHGIRPSGDGTRVYVGLENGDAMTAIDTLTNKVIATVRSARRRKPWPTCPTPCRMATARPTRCRPPRRARQRSIRDCCRCCRLR